MKPENKGLNDKFLIIIKGYKTKKIDHNNYILVKNLVDKISDKLKLN